MHLAKLFDDGSGSNGCEQLAFHIRQDLEVEGIHLLFEELLLVEVADSLECATDINCFNKLDLGL